MKVTYTIVLTIVLFNTYSQSTRDKLNQRETFLKTVKLKLTDSLTRVEKEIDNIKKEKEFLEYKESKQTLPKRYYSRLKGTNPYMTSSPLFGDIMYLKSGEIVELIDIVDNKIKIYYSASVGYVWLDQLESNSDLSELQNEVKKRDQFRQFEKDRELESIEQIFDSLKRSYGDSSKFIVRPLKGMNRKLYEIPNGKEIDELSYTVVLKIKEIYDDGYFVKVVGINKPIKGYIFRYELETTKDLTDHINKVVDERRKYEETKSGKERNISIEKRKSRLIQTFGSQTATKILNKEYWIGMTREQALESCGYPNTINETVGSWGQHEQWVYETLSN